MDLSFKRATQNSRARLQCYSLRRTSTTPLSPYAYVADSSPFLPSCQLHLTEHWEAGIVCPYCICYSTTHRAEWSHFTLLYNKHIYAYVRKITAFWIWATLCIFQNSVNEALWRQQVHFRGTRILTLICPSTVPTFPSGRDVLLNRKYFILVKHILHNLKANQGQTNYGKTLTVNVV